MERYASAPVKIYMAPLEGITGYVYRKTYQEVFHNVDKYFIPFVEPHQKRDFNAKELNEISREHNDGYYVVPQILTNQAEGFLRTAEALVKQGYEEVNLNLGCPSGTVVSKGKGSGFLEYPDQLDRFLQDIFYNAPCRISIKTRTGRYEPEEFGRLLDIFSQYPLEELIVHPRTREDYYKGKPDWDTFAKALEYGTARGEGEPNTVWPVCYNGDIFTPGDYERLLASFPSLPAVMLGRGIIGNPCLVDEIRMGNTQLQEKESTGPDRAKIRKFHDLIYQRYGENLSGERPLLFKMKEIWSYLGGLFPNQEKQIRKLKKVQKKGEYEAIVAGLFRKQMSDGVTVQT